MLRENFGLNQLQIAQFLEVDESIISSYEEGDRQYRIDHLEQLCNLFGIPLSELMEEKALLKSWQVTIPIDTLRVDDLKAIAAIQKIALNLHEMEILLEKAG